MNRPKMHFEALIFMIFLGTSLCKTAMFKIEGEVKAEEFTYYKILYPGNILLVLESAEGDADIYISDKTASPDYNADNYDFHSATCGTDVVFVPKTLRRPVIVGIYGHFLHNTSKFALQVYQMPDRGSFFSEDKDSSAEELEGENSDNPSGKSDSSENSGENNNRRDARKVPSLKSKRKQGKSMQGGLWPLLELFEMLFL